MASIKNQKELIAAFEELALPLERQVFYVCLNMMGNREDAEDCAQEAMLKAFRGFSRFEGRSKFSTWLYSIATNVCVDALRKRRDAMSLEDMMEVGWEVADTTPGLYERLEEKERQRLLKAALREIPVDFRAALTLVDLQGLPYQEAAEALDLPLGTVKSRVSRARNLLVKILLQQPELFDRDDRHKDERRGNQ